MSFEKQHVMHELKEVLTSQNVEVLACGYEKDDNNQFWVITPEAHLTLLVKEKDVVIAFKATTKPDVAAKMIVILSNMKYNVYVSDTFYVSPSGFFIGEDAYKAAEEEQAKAIMSELTKQVLYLRLLTEIPDEPPRSAWC